MVHDWRAAAAAAPCNPGPVPDGTLAGGAKKARSCVAIAGYAGVLAVPKVATDPKDEMTQPPPGG